MATTGILPDEWTTTPVALPDDYRITPVLVPEHSRSTTCLVRARAPRGSERIGTDRKTVVVVLKENAASAHAPHQDERR